MLTRAAVAPDETRGAFRRIICPKPLRRPRVPGGPENAPNAGNLSQWRLSRYERPYCGPTPWCRTGPSATRAGLAPCPADVWATTAQPACANSPTPASRRAWLIRHS